MSDMANEPPALSSLITYPTNQSVQATQTTQSRPVLKDRLFVGNLHPTVDEYTLLHIFSKYGKITKLDFLFHKSGPLKGKPRGYAFIEYAHEQDASKALQQADGRILRARKIVVTYAQQAPLDSLPSSSGMGRRREAERPTTLSLIKTGSVQGRKSDQTQDKIARMEAKLRQMEADSSGPSTLPAHPSLPPKPICAPLLEPSRDQMPTQQSASGPTRDHSSHVLLPVQGSISTQSSSPSSHIPSIPLVPLASSSSSTTARKAKPTSGLSGIRIKHHKEKASNEGV